MWRSQQKKSKEKENQNILKWFKFSLTENLIQLEEGKGEAQL